MKQLFYLVFSSLIMLPLLAERPAKAASEQGASYAAAVSESRTALRESRQDLHQQLTQATSTQERRQLLGQWRQKSHALIEHERIQRTAEHSVDNQHDRGWLRPEIPETVPAEKREVMELRFDMREAQMTIVASIKDANPEERREVMAAFREQNALKVQRLGELSESRRSASATNALAALPIPENLSFAQRAKLESRNERLVAINNLSQALANASPEDRRQAMAAYREQITGLRESTSLQEPIAIENE
ncbi:hypothetical protein [Cerasicoccus arenae]|nr:hypothetical protein [Cerasicoccus arenae]MBK1859896.1 hypothetical protein [Cerasicoccus arenae]